MAGQVIHKSRRLAPLGWREFGLVAASPDANSERLSRQFYRHLNTWFDLLLCQTLSDFSGYSPDDSSRWSDYGQKDDTPQLIEAAP
jgi:hypothetical protein